MRKNVFYTLLMMVLVLFFTKYNIQANTGKPAKPVIQSVKSNDVGKIQVKYREVSGVNGYQIMLSENQKFTSDNIIVTVKSGKITSKKISKLKKGTKYFVRVRAYKKTGKEKVYGKWSAVKTVTTQNNVPDIYSITSKKNSIIVAWNKVVGGKGYQVQYATDRKFKKAKTKSVNDNRKNSITITGLKYGEKYYVRIRVLNKKSASGKYGQWGSTMTIKVGLPNPDHSQANMDATEVPVTESKADTTEASGTFESDSVTEETSPSVQVNPNLGEGEAQPSTEAVPMPDERETESSTEAAPTPDERETESSTEAAPMPDERETEPSTEAAPTPDERETEPSTEAASESEREETPPSAPLETETEKAENPDDKEASVWGFNLNAWTNDILHKVVRNGNADTRTSDGGHTYTAYFNCDGGKNWADNVEFAVEDVTPNAYKKMYASMEVESGIISQTSEIITRWPIYNYGNGIFVDTTPEIFEPLDSSKETPPVRSQKASAQVRLTINAKMGSRCLRVTAIKDKQILDIIYLTASSEDNKSDSSYHPKDLELYAAVRHKVELVLWKNCVTNLDKICAVAAYINSTTHYPGEDITSKLYNPTLWKEWSVDGLDELYYNVGNDVMLNRTMDLQGGIVTCQAADLLLRVATEDLGLPYLYDSTTREVSPGEGVWIGMGSYSTNPSSPYHETLWYKDDTEIKCGIDAQGMGYDGSTDKAACEAHKCADKIIPLA